MNETTGALANFFEGLALSLGIVLAVAVCCSLVGRIFLNRYERALRVRLEELEHLQKQTGVSDSTLGHMLGNAVTGDYCVELWRHLLSASGLV